MPPPIPLRLPKAAVSEGTGGRPVAADYGGERILVCVGFDERAVAVVGAAQRLADRLGASLIAVSVDRPGGAVSAEGRRLAAAALHLAGGLGAETRVTTADDMAGEIVRLARLEGATQIVLGASRRRSWPFRSTLADALIRKASGLAVHVVAAGGDGEGERRRTSRDAPLRAYGEATAGVFLALVCGEGLARLVAGPNVSPLFLLAVLMPAIRFGIWPAVYASTLSFVAYNFFFIDPTYTLSVARPYELMALAIFLVVAVITSAVAGRSREEARGAIRRVRATRRLFEFTRKLSSLADGIDIAEAAAAEVQAILGRSTVLLVERDGALAVVAAWPPEDRLDAASTAAARDAFDRREAAGWTAGDRSAVPWLFLPLVVRRGAIGVLGIARDGGVAPDTETRALIDALVEQIAVAIDRATLAREIAATRAAAETERVRNVLLASISHDFRTPLASVLGAASSLTEFGDRLPPEQRADLLLSIREEAEHLDGMVRNLLSMMRLEAGALEIRRDWVDVGEILERVAAAARRRGATQAIVVSVPAALPLVRADASLIEQAVGNVVGNAVRYAGARARIGLSASAGDGTMRIAVEDDGPGITADHLPHVFEKFFRAARAGGDGGEGTGLGLAITRGIVEAHGGEARVESPAGAEGGARFVLVLPLREREP